MWNQEKADLLIPKHMHDDLKLYLEAGVIFDGFLLAVLRNDLREAVYSADAINAARLPDYVKYLFNYAPSQCWGSPSNVREWCQDRQIMRDGGPA
jgi:hypothetical protein